MRWKRIVAAAATTGAVALAGIGATAVTAQASPAGLGLFKSWRSAQAAAEFSLLRPTRTYGHVRNGDIGVTRCEVKKSTKRVVFANYGLTPFSTLAIFQNNSGAACSSVGKVTPLGKVKVNGATAMLTGKCGMKGLRSCKSRRIFLFLTWTRHGNYYMATSFGEPSRILVGFARGLRPVR